MEKSQEEKVRKEIIRCKRQPKNMKLQEKVFGIVKDQIVASLKIAMKSYRKYLTNEELLSMAWDVFTEVVSKYDKESPIGAVLNSTSLFHIKRLIAKENRSRRRFFSLEILGGVILDSDDSHQVVYEPLIDLKEFRKRLPPEYRLVFDDALKSMGSNNRYKARDLRCPLSVGKYYESKKVFQMLIEFFLRAEGKS